MALSILQKKRTTYQYTHPDLQNKFNDMIESLDMLQEDYNSTQKLHAFVEKHDLRSQNGNVIDTILGNFENILAVNKILRTKLAKYEDNES